jgi:hypothetical protein
MLPAFCHSAICILRAGKAHRGPQAKQTAASMSGSQPPTSNQSPASSIKRQESRVTLFKAEEKRKARNTECSRITGQAWPPPQRQTLHRWNYFQQLSSLICAIDCRGSEIIESHSLHTPTRMFENVTRERFICMSRVS